MTAVPFFLNFCGRNRFHRGTGRPISKDMNRKFLIAGNWKMNKSAAEAALLAKEIVQGVGQQHDVEVLICPPFTALESTARALENSTVKLGAQNMHPEAAGAFTGEISAEMLRDHFTTHVLLGHSERRTLFGESDDFINQKVLAALKSRLRPVLCVGETLEERESGQTAAVVERHVTRGLSGVDAEQADSLVIAYEPVWAIGTGKTATPDQAQEVHAGIRQLLAAIMGENAARKIRILYGGSMKPANAEDLLGRPDIDGGLIGGASLEARSFVQMVRTALEIKK